MHGSGSAASLRCETASCRRCFASACCGRMLASASAVGPVASDRVGMSCMDGAGLTHGGGCGWAVAVAGMSTWGV